MGILVYLLLAFQFIVAAGYLLLLVGISFTLVLLLYRYVRKHASSLVPALSKAKPAERLRAASAGLIFLLLWLGCFLLLALRGALLDPVSPLIDAAAFCTVLLNDVIWLVYAFALFQRAKVSTPEAEPRVYTYRDGTPGEVAHHAAPWRHALELLAEDVRGACALLGVLAIVVATPFLSSRVVSLARGTVSVSSLRADPSILVGVPLMLIAWTMIFLRVEILNKRAGQAKVIMAASALLGSAVWSIWIAAGGVHFGAALPRVRGQKETLADLLRNNLAPDGSVASSRIPWPSWTMVLAAFLGAFAILVALTALRGLRTWYKHSRGDVQG